MWSSSCEMIFLSILPSSSLLHLFAFSLSFTFRVIIWSQFCFNGWDHFDSLKRGSKLTQYPDLSPLESHSERESVLCVCACARLSGPFYRSKPKTCPWTRKKKKKKATCHDSARHGRTWLYRSVHKQSVLELLKQSLQPPATKVSDKNKHIRGASEQRGGKWNQGLQEVWSPERNKCLSSGSVS